MRFLTILILWLATAPAYAEEIGAVDTVWKLLGANHKIVVEVFDDPKVEGVSCFVSRAKTGGISGSLGLAENTSDASIGFLEKKVIYTKLKMKAYFLIKTI